MSTIVTIAAGDSITNSRTDINGNFSALNSDKFETSNVDTDTSLAANSDSKVASQKATKAYVDAAAGATAASGTTTKDLSATTTTTIAHGLGASPRVVRLTGMFATGSTTTLRSLAYATFISSTQSSVSTAIWDNTGSNGTSSLTQTFRISGANSGVGDYLEGTISVDATNISIVWASTGSPTGTANLVWEAVK